MKKTVFLKAFFALAGVMGLSSICAQNYIPVPEGADDATIMQAALSVRPSERQMAWQELEYYGFIHFGPNTFTGSEWGDGTTDPSLFNPLALDANQWAKAFKNAGMKGLILTAKHHDGFCLWPTATTGYSVAKSPWRNGKGDLVKEVADACRAAGIKFGIYLSPWDRNHPSYGDSPAYNEVFRNQLTELLTNYGDVFEVWFDGANGEGPNGKVQQYDFESYYALIRRLQPNAVIAIMGPDVRWVGNEAGKGRDPEWSVLPVEVASRRKIASDSQQNVQQDMFVPKDARGNDLGSREKLKGTTGIIWYPSEVDTSVRPGWFYHASQDDKVKSPQHLEDIYYSSIGMNSTLLLNIPPDRRGLIHENDIDNLMAFRRRIDSTFAVNLAEKAKVKSAGTVKGHEPGKITDGDKNTYWTTNGTEKELYVEFRFKKPVTFDRLMLQENIRNGQRIEAFQLEVYQNRRWVKIAEAQTVGYKRLLRFEPVTSAKVRVKFTAFRAAPELIEAGLYLAPVQKAD